MKAAHCEGIEIESDGIRFNYKEFIWFLLLIGSLITSFVIMPQQIMSQVETRFFSKELGLRLEKKQEIMDEKLDRLLEIVSHR